MDPNADETDTPKAKRQKVSIACDTCRTKKIKCDGIGPVCAPCAKRKTASCTWNGHNSRNSAQFSRDQTQATDTRSHAQEEESRKPAETHQPFHRSAVIQSPEAHTGFPLYSPYVLPQVNKSGVDIPQQTWGFRPTETSADIASTLLTAATSSPRRSPIHEDNPIERATCPMIRPLTDNSQSPDFLGGSSAGNFISQIRKAVQRKMGNANATESSARSEEQAWPSNTAKSNTTVETPDYVLPPRRKADQLMEIYWQMVHPFYPFLDKQETTHKYESLWTGKTNDGEDVTFLCILNTIFAHSCLLNEAVDPGDRQTSAHVFFCRCKELLDPWRLASLQTVQLYLMLGCYLQSTHEPHKCWLIIGSATRTAQSLSLHLPETSLRIRSPRKRETVRKIWHGCVLMDSIVAMTFGRPTMISTSVSLAVPYPLAIDEDRLPTNEGDAVPPIDQPSDLHFFVKTLELCKILQDVTNGLHSTYPQTMGNVEDIHEYYLDNHLSLFETDRKLVIWEKTTPEHLKVEEKQLPNMWPVYARQAVVLRHRFLHVKLLSLRPILSAFITSDVSDLESSSHFGSTLRHRVALQCSVVCVKVAQETIDLAYSNLPANPAANGNLPAWWYNVLFVYSAATVLVAARLRSSILSEIPHDKILKSWDRAIKVLGRYNAYSPLIDKFITALHLLFNAMSGRHSQQKQQPQQSDIHNGQASVPEREQRQQISANGFSGLNPNESEGLGDTHVAGVPLASGLSWSEAADTFEMEELMLDFDPNDLSWLNTVPFEL